MGEIAEMVSRLGRQDNPGRYLLLAGLTALLLLSGADDVVLPPLWGATVQAAATPSPDVEDYCRIRRDARAEVRSVVLAGTGAPTAAPAIHQGARPLPVLATSGRPVSSPVPEHRPHLARRTRSPGDSAR